MNNNKTVHKLILIGFEGVRRVGKSIYHFKRVEGELVIGIVEAAIYLSRINYIKIKRPKLNIVRGRY